MRLLLELESPSGERSRREVRGKEFRIGSAPACDLRIEADGLEPEQARIEIASDHLRVFNRGELPLVRARGRAISSTVLDFEEWLEIGGWKLRFRSTTPDEAALRLRRSLLAELAERIDLRELDVENLGESELRELCGAVLDELLDERAPKEARAELRREILNEALGLGPLQELLHDESVSEIMANGPEEIFVERSGRLERVAARFASEAHLMNTIQRMVWPIGRRVDESSPLVDARLPDGSRVNAVLAPVAIGGPYLTVRKFFRVRRSLDDLVVLGAFDRECAALLRHGVQERLNIVVSGGASAGKTTLLNAMAACIPAGQRVVTVEDAAELQLPLENLCSLEARPPNLEGRGAISIRDLVRNALRMRPDRIIVGECRGGEALDMLQAMNSGNDGSLATLHANSPEDALLRLETMVLMAGVDLPSLVIRRQIIAGVDWIVHLERQADGRRVVSRIVEVEGLCDGEFRFRPRFDPAAEDASAAAPNRAAP